LINYIPYETNATDDYTNQQIEFSREIIEQWSNFINYGRPNSTKFENQWLPIADGNLMHLKLNQSQMKKFDIPSNVQFWMKTCLAHNQGLIVEISLTIFFCTTVFIIYELVLVNE
jgi:carboxylesterase type B